DLSFVVFRNGSVLVGLVLASDCGTMGVFIGSVLFALVLVVFGAFGVVAATDLSYLGSIVLVVVGRWCYSGEVLSSCCGGVGSGVWLTPCGIGFLMILDSLTMSKSVEIC
ncbi:hypothetical protein A2U01_0060502, partial [Trifolium medium]|nr:hypothetical protein [Trifolium medium]